MDAIDAARAAPGPAPPAATPGPADGRVPRRGVGRRRATTTSSCSSGSPSSRSRRASRGRRSCASGRPSARRSAGFDPGSSRLRRRRPGPADGATPAIVRNRREDRRHDRQRPALFLATARGFGSFDAYLAAMVPPPPARLPPDARRRRHPRHDAGLGRACRRTSGDAASGSSARRSSTRSCRASGSSTTTCPGCFRYARTGRDRLGVTRPASKSRASNPPWRPSTARPSNAPGATARARAGPALQAVVLRRLPVHRATSRPDPVAPPARRRRLTPSVRRAPAGASRRPQRRGPARKTTLTISSPMPMTAIVVEPLVASMSAPPTSSPIGCRPSEIVRAVLPTRPRSASGE